MWSQLPTVFVGTIHGTMCLEFFETMQLDYSLENEHVFLL